MHLPGSLVEKLRAARARAPRPRLTWWPDLLLRVRGIPAQEPGPLQLSGTGRPLPPPARLLRLKLRALVVLYLLYLLAGLHVTGAWTPYSITFWLLELLAATAMTLLVLPALLPDPPPPPAAPPHEGDLPTVDVIVPALDAHLDAIRRTALATEHMRGRTRTILISDNPDVGDLAKELGCDHQETGGLHWLETLNGMLSELSGCLLAIFAPAHVPHSDFLYEVAPLFAETSTAMVQVALSQSAHSPCFDSGPTTSEQSPRGMPNTMELRDRWNAVPWLGTNAIFRRSALVDSGGFAPGCAPWGTSARLQATGWRTRYWDHRLSFRLEDDDGILELGSAKPLLGAWHSLQQGLTPVQRFMLIGDRLSFAPALLGFFYLIAPLLAIGLGLSAQRGNNPLVATLWAAVLLPSLLGLRRIHRELPDVSRVLHWSHHAALSPLAILLRRLPFSDSPRARTLPVALLSGLLWGCASWLVIGAHYGIYERPWDQVFLALPAFGAGIAAWSLFQRLVDRSELCGHSKNPVVLPGHCYELPSVGIQNEGEDPRTIDPEPVECVVQDFGAHGIGLLVHQELPLGSRHVVTFACDDTTVSVRAVLVYVEPKGKEGKYRYYLRPEPAHRRELSQLARRLKDQRPKRVKSLPPLRRSPRFDVKMAVQIEGAEGGPIDGITANVSATGLSMSASRAPAIGAEILVRVFHPTLPGPLRATVVRAEQIDEQSWSLGLNLERPNAALAQIVAPPGTPLFIDARDQDHEDAIKRRAGETTDNSTDVAEESSPDSVEIQAGEEPDQAAIDPAGQTVADEAPPVDPATGEEEVDLAGVTEWLGSEVESEGDSLVAAPTETKESQ